MDKFLVLTQKELCDTINTFFMDEIESLRQDLIEGSCVVGLGANLEDPNIEIFVAEEEGMAPYHSFLLAKSWISMRIAEYAQKFITDESPSYGTKPRHPKT